MNSLKRMRPLLGTFVEIGVATPPEDGDVIVTEAFEKIAEIHKLLSFQDPDSDLSRLNKAGLKGVELNPLSATVLRLALNMTAITEGDFNCTVGGALVRKGLLPDHSGLPLLEMGNAEDVVFDGGRVTLRRPVRITLDGIAKGYAVDKAVEWLVSRGIHSGWINAGGDLRVFGEVLWPVHRRELDESITFLGNFSNTAIATSSNLGQDDERFPGVIIDSNNTQRIKGIWTVKAGLAWLADALTKVAGTTYPDQAKSRVSAFGGELLHVLAL
jgi:thiamine biosynthesis lipoprotein